MKNLKSLSLEVKENKLSILDQTLLPHEERWVEVSTSEDLVGIIKKLQVRGAPLIGVSASIILALESTKDYSKEDLLKKAKQLKQARPTAVNLMVCVDRLITLINQDATPKELQVEAENIFNEDVELCQKISNFGAELINEGDNIITHCNTGGLATVGSGTALGIIKKAHEQGKNIHVYVDETRPLLQGGRLTTWELKKLGIPFTLICDNMAGHLMLQNKIDKCFVGADRIATNGDFANKVGTYSLAILCKTHNIPFYVAAPYTTVDFDCPNGKEVCPIVIASCTLSST